MFAKALPRQAVEFVRLSICRAADHTPVTNPSHRDAGARSNPVVKARSPSNPPLVPTG
jgi:hypothetical protein